MGFEIKRGNISLNSIKSLTASGDKISLHPDLQKSVIDCRKYLENAVDIAKKPIYGVNTGFGSLCNTSISKEEISELQVNLVLSHACGTGDVIPEEVSRLMLLLKIVNLSLGHSGIRIETLDRLIFMYNEEITPVVFELGSLGASGDLAPLAHLSLPLINRGDVWYKGERCNASTLLSSLGKEAIVLDSKEGLALLNGTQFMSAFSVHILM